MPEINEVEEKSTPPSQPAAAADGEEGAAGAAAAPAEAAAEENVDAQLAEGVALFKRGAEELQDPEAMYHYAVVLRGRAWTRAT